MTEQLREIIKCPSCGNFESKRVFVKKIYSGKLCLNCGLVFISPVADNNRLIYSDDSSSSPSRYYELSQKADKKTFAKRLNMLAGFADKGSLVDIGCSTGNFMLCAVEKGWKTVHGIEPNPVSASICRDKKLNIIHDFLNENSVNKFPCSFDAVHMGDIIEHTEDPVQTLNMVKMLMKKQGILMIVTPDFNSFLTRKLQIKPQEHLLYFNIKSLRYLLDSCGFQILHLETGTRVHSFKAIKYSTTFSNNSLYRFLLNIFYIPGMEFLANLALRLFIKDEILVIAKFNG